MAGPTPAQPPPPRTALSASLTPVAPPITPYLRRADARPPPHRLSAHHLRTLTSPAPPAQVSVVHSEDGVVEAEVMAVNKGGAMLQVEGLRAFMPGSHYLPGQTPTEALVGQKLKAQP